MDEYRSLAVFAAVHDAGSFSAAGRRLKLSTSVVSHHVSKLEDKVGASLFFRSTRSLSLTPEGAAILPAARAMVAAAKDALDVLAATNDQLVGALRVTLPALGDRNPLNRAILQFAGEHPLVSVTIHNSDHQVDLVKDGFDLAIRLGVLRDSALKSKRIGTFGRKIVASPDYLAKRPPIKTLTDLQKCDFIALAMLPNTITLARKQDQVSLETETL
ncbi:MAG: LysR family transcriptional regulator, partial [Pseudomonadota bacterium]